MIEQKDSEIADKNATIKAYLDKIVNFYFYLKLLHLYID